MSSCLSVVSHDSGTSLVPAAQLHLASRYILQEEVRASRASGVCASAGASMRTFPNSVIQKSHPHLIVKGTNQEQEVQRPTLTRPCARCCQIFTARPMPSKPRGNAYCGECHRVCCLAYKQRRREVLAAFRREYENTRGQPPARGWGTVLERTSRHSARCPL
jgi:hypothetical protein